LFNKNSLIIYFFQNFSNFENSVIYVKAAQVLWYSYNLKTCCLCPNSKSGAQNQSKTPFLESKIPSSDLKNQGARGFWFLEEKGENLFKPNEIFFEARGRIKVWPLWYFFRSYQKYFWWDKRDIHKVRKTQHQYPSISYWDLIKFLYFMDTTKRGVTGWKEAQRQGEHRVTLSISLVQSPKYFGILGMAPPPLSFSLHFTLSSRVTETSCVFQSSGSLLIRTYLPCLRPLSSLSVLHSSWRGVLVLELLLRRSKIVDLLVVVVVVPTLSYKTAIQTKPNQKQTPVRRHPFPVSHVKMVKNQSQTRKIRRNYFLTQRRYTYQESPKFEESQLILLRNWGK